MSKTWTGTSEYTEIAYKYMLKYSNSLAISKMQTNLHVIPMYTHQNA